MSFLFVGVGNPGNEYQGTRHNIAWDCFDGGALDSELHWKSKFKGEYAQISRKGENNYFLKPQTYMNLSGESVLPCSKFFKVSPKNIVVLHDDIDLDFGLIVLKKGGGLAGHNGLKSIAKVLGTRDFLRMRIGVGRPKYGDVSNHVLSKFSQDESIFLDKVYDLVTSAVEEIIKVGFERASNKFSRKRVIME